MTLLERLVDGGEVFLTHTTVSGEVVLRVSIGAPATERRHVERLWALLGEATTGWPPTSPRPPPRPSGQPRPPCGAEHTARELAPEQAARELAARTERAAAAAEEPQPVELQTVPEVDPGSTGGRAGLSPAVTG